MTSVAVCMSPGEGRDTLTAMLKHIFEEFCAEVSILLFSNTAELFAALPSQAFALMLFDTELTDRKGVEAARLIRNRGYSCPLLFVSGSDQEALASYDVHAAGFFVQPVPYERLRAVLRRNRGAFLHSLRSLRLVSGRIERSIYLMDITYIEASGHTSVLHTLRGPLSAVCSIAQLAEQLAGEPFLYCHRSYLVNRGLIVRVEGKNLLMADGTTVPLSANRAGELQQALSGNGFPGWGEEAEQA